MASDLELMLGLPSPGLEWEPEAKRAGNHRLHEVGFLTAWELQSQVATLAFVALVALVPVWLALTCMLCWSLTATFIYWLARKNGLPDLLNSQWCKPPGSLAGLRSWLSATGFAVLKTTLAGIQPFLYSRILSPVLLNPARDWRNKAIHWLVLSVGFTLFGVTTVHHLLEQAGTPKERILRLSLVAPFLNVPYRLLLSALVVNTILQLAQPLRGG